MLSTEFFFEYVCPSLGCVMSAAMYAGTNVARESLAPVDKYADVFTNFSFPFVLSTAPVNDLRRALLAGKLGPLNPVPWAVMTGNCMVSQSIL